MTDDNADDKVFDWMETIAQERVPGVHHMTWTLRHLLQRFPSEHEVHYVVSVALDNYAADTATMSGAIRKEMAARRGGETLMPGLMRGRA